MLTETDIKRLQDQVDTQTRRIQSAEEACKRSTEDWSKNFWYGVFKKLCRKYNRMDYFKKSIN
jgi:hypothetical protein